MTYSSLYFFFFHSLRNLYFFHSLRIWAAPLTCLDQYKATEMMEYQTESQSPESCPHISCVFGWPWEPAWAAELEAGIMWAKLSPLSCLTRIACSCGKL